MAHKCQIFSTVKNYNIVVRITIQHLLQINEYIYYESLFDFFQIWGCFKKVLFNSNGL